MAPEPDQSATPLTRDPLWQVCFLLQRHHVNYVLVGARACAFYGLVRSTQDVDLLIEPSAENMQRVIDALSELPDHAARELTVKDLEENVVVKVADEVMVDVSKQAWTLDYAEAICDAQTLEIEGVKIIYASLDALIKSKSTYREQDRIDRQQLIRLKQDKQKR
ncbi:MAG TPA: nucleotidyltransferase [Verrucomicrobiae bacterium]|nr:nucleotidyltransferase [Verrucomicrobiae bacterium]